MTKTEQTTGKGKMKDIVTALLHSEIPEIQTIINELFECTKQLEEHSQKLQNYALKIQELAGEEAEVPVETDLIERLKSLEKTLAELKGKAIGLTSEFKPEAKVRELATKEVVEETKEIEKEVTPLLGRRIIYTTPEGFTVRRRTY